MSNFALEMHKKTLIGLIALGFALSPTEVTAQLEADRLVDHHRKIGALKNSMPGFRIQVFFGPERQKAQETKTQLTALYAENQTYLVYQQPNFKVRLGDFKTRLEASRFLQQVQSSYPGAFIVPDEVRLPEL